MNGPSYLGGMGQVQHATCRLYQREVAIKRLRTDVIADRSVLEHEHVVLSELVFPGVVHVWEWLRVADQSFLVTEWIDGRRLDAFLAADPTPDEVTRVFYQLLVALSWVHSQGVVHGDLKPANILVVSEPTGPRPVLIDFGLAYTMGRLSNPMVSGGTKTFMAPELWSGQLRLPTPSSDLYALGLSFLHSSHGVLPESVRTLCTAMSHHHPMRRPTSAGAALSQLQWKHSSDRNPFPTGRSLAPLWSPWLEQLVPHCSKPGSRQWICGPADSCTQALARRLGALLDLAPDTAPLTDVRIVPEPKHPAPLRFYERLAHWWRALVLGDTAPVDAADPPAVAVLESDENREFPELWRTMTDRLVEELVGILDQSALVPILIVPGLAGRSIAELTLLSQLWTAVPRLSVVVIAEKSPGPETAHSIPHSLTACFTDSPQPVPGPDAIAAYITVYGRGSATDKALHILRDRAQAGVDAVRSQMDVWLASGALVPRIDGSLRFLDEKLHAAQPGETTTTLWHLLWMRLHPRLQAVIRLLFGVAGTAKLDELKSNLDVDASVIDDLAMAGWIEGSATHSSVKLNPVVMASLSEWDSEASTDATRRRCLAVLRNRDELTATEWLFLANYQQALGDGDFLEPLSEAQRRYLTDGQPQIAGEIAMRKAHHLVEFDLVGAFGQALWAAKVFVAAGAQDAAQVATETAIDWAKNDPRLAAEAHLAAAGVALHGGKTESVRDHIQAFRAEWPQPLRQHDRQLARFRAEASLILGSALALSGQLSAAEQELHIAKDLGARGFDDPQSVASRLFFGKLENNVGNLALQQACWKEAAAAYRRSADQKRAIGDRRGQRIAGSNLAIALRQSEDLFEAAHAAISAHRLAKSLGDLRGVAMGHLVLAALAVDTAAIELAEDQLAALDTIGPSSAFVELDAALCRVRLHLLESRFGAATQLAKETWERAQTAVLVARQAWGLWQVARFLEGGGQNWVTSDQTTANVRDPSLTTADAWSVPDYLDLAVATLRAALTGQWDLARLGLENQPPAPVGGEPGLRLLCEAADIVGQGDSQRLVVARWRRDRSAQCLKLRTTMVVDTPWSCHPARFRVWTGPEAPWAKKGLPVADRRLTAPVATPPPNPPPQTPPQDRPDPDLAPTNQDIPSIDPKGSPQPPIPQQQMPTPGSQWVRVGGPPDLPKSVGELAEWLEHQRKHLGATSAAMWARAENSLHRVMTTGAEEPPPFSLAVAELEKIAPNPWIARSKDHIEQLLVPFRWDGDLTAILAIRFDSHPKPTEVPNLTAFTQLEPLFALLGGLRRLEATNQSFRQLLAKLETDVKTQKASFLAEVSQLRDELHQSRLDSQLRKQWSQVVRRSAAMQKTIQTLDRVASSELPVLLLGESGVGKELLAQLIHQHSDTKPGPFVSENCGAIPSELFESIFFGVQKGAFTGANENKAGLVELANGGTLFLDEVGDLRADHQVKLLRVIQEHRFRRVGGQSELVAHFRLICATNRDLGAEVAAGRFREDLYFRIAVVPVVIPPLRDRMEDIAPLVTHFLEQQTAQTGKRWTLSRDALNVLEQYGWPGNVRELENEVLRATVLAEGERLDVHHFSDKLTAVRARPAEATAVSPEGMTAGWNGVSTLQEHIDAMERAIIMDALEKTGGQKLKTAELLGLSRPGLDAKLERFDLAHLPREIKSRSRSRP